MIIDKHKRKYHYFEKKYDIIVYILLIGIS